MDTGKNIDKKAVRNLRQKNARDNRFRNSMTFCSIVLTIMLFTIIFTLVYSMLDAVRIQRMKEVGTTAHGQFKDITLEQYHVLEQSVGHNGLADISYDIFVGNGKNKEFSKYEVDVRYAEAKAVKWGMVTLTEGRLPENENEIVLDDVTLGLLGITPEIGAGIHLSILCGDRMLEKDFVLCGYYKKNTLMDASEVYISKEFVETEVYSIRTEEEWLKLMQEKKTIGEGLLNASCYLHSSKKIEKTLTHIWSESKLGEVPDLGINWAYESNFFQGMGWKTIAGLGLALFVIMTAGYLMIYNIYYISVVRDTNYYGLLKIIGMTNVQLKRMIKNQSRIIYAVSMPFGLLAGWVVGSGLAPYLMIMVNHMEEYKPSGGNGIIFIFSILFSYLTVAISIRKPCKIVSGISPMEALRYNGSDCVPGKKGKKEGKVSLYGMAWRNLFRDKKKTSLLICSISLVILLFFVLSDILSGISFDRYVDAYTVGDYYVSSSALLNDSEMEGMDEKDYQELRESKWGSYCSKQYYQSCVHQLSKTAVQNIAGMDKKGVFQTEDGREYQEQEEEIVNGNSAGYISENRYYFSKAILDKFQVLEGKIDYDKLSTGKYIIVIAQMGGLQDISVYHPGDRIELSNSGEEAKMEGGKLNFDKTEYEVMAVVKPIFVLSTKVSFGVLDLNTIMYMQDADAVVADAVLYSLAFDVPDDMVEPLGHYLQAYMNERVDLDYNSAEEAKQSYASFKVMFQMIGGVLILFIGLIALFNYMNCVATGMIIRKKEFAVLKSIGMQEKQLITMLRAESIYYIMISFIISMVTGSMISIGVIRNVTKGLFWFDYQFNMIPMFVILPILVFVGILLPKVIYRFLRGKSITEELHEN